ncbi:MAG: ATPase, T2SS/T4P/T4SS family, partial [Patescibacteria group bacterium]
MPNTPQQPASKISQAQLDEAKSVLDILFSEGLITKEQYEEIKVQSATQGISPLEILKEKGLISEERIAEAQAKLLGIPYISLATVSFSPQAISFLPQAVVERFLLIPFFFDDQTRTLSIAMANPIDLDAIAFVQQKTGLNIQSFAAAPSEVKNAITQQYHQELVGDVGEAIRETEEFTKKPTPEGKQNIQTVQEKEAPIAKIVSTILQYALSSRASDVHIEPQDDRLRVRYRIDGILYDKLSLPKNVRDSLISRIKILAELKIDEHRMPQDGRFNFKVNKDEVDLRVSTIPTVKGEKIVMRLLRKSGGIPTLTELGFTGSALRALESSILRPHGIILVCGPT